MPNNIPLTNDVPTATESTIPEEAIENTEQLPSQTAIEEEIGEELIIEDFTIDGICGVY